MNNQNNSPLPSKDSMGASNISNKPEIKKSKLFITKTLSVVLGILGLLIVLSIIGGGAMLASHMWNPSWNPFEQHADKGLKEKIFKKP